MSSFGGNLKTKGLSVATPATQFWIDGRENHSSINKAFPSLAATFLLPLRSLRNWRANMAPMPPLVLSVESLVLSASSSSSVNGRSPDHFQVNFVSSVWEVVPPYFVRTFTSNLAPSKFACKVISGDFNSEDEDGYAADFEESMNHWKRR